MQMIEERGAAGLDRAHVLCTVALEAGRMGKRELQARDDIGRRHQMHELRGSEQAARVASRRDAATLREVLPHFSCRVAGEGGGDEQGDAARQRFGW